VKVKIGLISQVNLLFDFNLQEWTRCLALPDPRRGPTHTVPAISYKISLLSEILSRILSNHATVPSARPKGNFIGKTLCSQILFCLREILE